MRKTDLKFSNEKGLNFKIETIIKRPSGEIEKYKGWIEVDKQKYEAYWLEDGTCLSIMGKPTSAGNLIELASLNIVAEIPFSESDFPKNCTTRSGVWFRLNSMIYNFIGQPVILVGEIKINNMNRQTFWNGAGTCHNGQDYDLVVIDQYKD